MLVLRNTNQIPSLFDRFFDGDMFDWNNRNFSSTNTTLPSVNIKDNAEAFKVEVAAPGFEKGDFKIVWFYRDGKNNFFVDKSEERRRAEMKGLSALVKAE